MNKTINPPAMTEYHGLTSEDVLILFDEQENYVPGYFHVNGFCYAWDRNNDDDFYFGRWREFPPETGFAFPLPPMIDDWKPFPKRGDYE